MLYIYLPVLYYHGNLYVTEGAYAGGRGFRCPSGLSCFFFFFTSAHHPIQHVPSVDHWRKYALSASALLGRDISGYHGFQYCIS